MTALNKAARSVWPGRTSVGFFDAVRRELTYVRTGLTLTRRVRDVKPDSAFTTADLFEQWVKKTPDAPAIYFEDRVVTWKEFDQGASRFTRWAMDVGVGRGDAVAILMENRPEFLMAWYGLIKIGAIGALINTHQTAAPLAHSLNISGARHLILDAAYAEYVKRNDYESGIELVSSNENVVMTRTFSKVHGLGGARIGWIYAPAHIIDTLNRLRGPFNVNAAAIEAGAAAMRDRAHVEKSIAHNDRWLTWLTAELTGLGLRVTPSVGRSQKPAASVPATAPSVLYP